MRLEWPQPTQDRTAAPRHQQLTAALPGRDVGRPPPPGAPSHAGAAGAPRAPGARRQRWPRAGPEGRDDFCGGAPRLKMAAPEVMATAMAYSIPVYRLPETTYLGDARRCTEMHGDARGCTGWLQPGHARLQPGHEGVGISAPSLGISTPSLGISAPSLGISAPSLGSPPHLWGSPPHLKWGSPPDLEAAHPMSMTGTILHDLATTCASGVHYSTPTPTLTLTSTPTPHAPRSRPRPRPRPR